MHSVIVKNLQIQFDSQSGNESEAIDILNAINSALQSLDLPSQPQLFVNAVDSSDIEITPLTDEE